MPKAYNIFHLQNTTHSVVDRKLNLEGFCPKYLQNLGQNGPYKSGKVGRKVGRKLFTELSENYT